MEYINWQNATGLSDINDKIINPATEDKQDGIIALFTDIQSPIPTDWDSVYRKDLDVDNSDIWWFTGTISSLFDDYNVEIVDSSATNPKIIKIRFHRPISSNAFWIWSKTGDFSNVKILLKDLAWIPRVTLDDSANNTKYTSNVYNFTHSEFIEVEVQFHTTDTITLNGAFLPKQWHVVAVISWINDITGLAEQVKVDNGELIIWGTIKIKDSNNQIIDPAIKENLDTLIDDFTTTDKTYIGKAEAGALESATVWQIQCLDETWNITKAKFADWDTSFTKEWDERTTYSYT